MQARTEAMALAAQGRRSAKPLPPLPWAWWRDAIARRYGVRHPWEVDDWPHDEVLRAVALMQYDPEAFPGGRAG